MSDIIIREATIDDAAAIRAIYAPYVESTVITFEYDVPSVEEFRQRIAHTKERYPYFVAEEDGRVVGYAYAGSFVGRAAYDWAAELSIYVDIHLKKHGLGEETLWGSAGCPEADGHPGCVCLHRPAGKGGRIPGLQQRRIPCPPGLYPRGAVQKVRLQIRPLVQYDLDGAEPG